MHQSRLARNGTTDYVGNAKPGKRPHSAGYVLIAAPGHPRALGGYRAYEHRVVFTEAHGEGPFECHWCGVAVTWGDMHVDHVNDVKTDNSPANLVASCAKCNKKRGEPASARRTRESVGRMLTHNGLTLCVSQWARRLGIAHGSILRRLSAGWSVDRALTEPRGKFGPTSTRKPPS
jgi:5-methylcytosine-specific restriction endonuclease McrA